MSKNTKIVATVGPASGDLETLKALHEAGVDVMRLNFSHGDHEVHEKYIERIKKIRDDESLAIMQDLPGPKIRVGEMPEDGMEVKTGDKLVFSEVPGEGDITVNYEGFSDIVSSGDTLLVDDGTKQLKALESTDGKVKAVVEAGGIISSNKGINIPGVKLKESVFTERDKKHLTFGLEQGIDMVAVSFVESGSDIREVKDFLERRDAGDVGVVAKIEREVALKDIENILEVADGIIAARGDMGVQMHFSQVPFVQKQLIEEARHRAKPAITATHMLDSMLKSSRPTRAEVTDITNAVLDGTDAVMLSGETAVGDYPVESVKVMVEVLKEAENNLPTYSKDDIAKPRHVPSAIALSAVEIAEEVEAGAIFVLTESGSTARLVSRYRPKQSVFALTPNKHTLSKLSMSWGVRGVLIEGAESIPEAVNQVKEIIKEKDIDIGEHFVLCAGVPFARPGTTNLVFVESV